MAAAKSLIVLRKDWPGPFRRTITTGRTPTQMVFAPGEPVEVDAKTAKALEKDIGQALNFCRIVQNGKIELIETAETEAATNEPEATD